MFMRLPFTSRWSRGRLAVVAAALIVARVLAWELHAIEADHGPLDHCAICVQVDRLPCAAAAAPLPIALDRPAVPAPAPVLPRKSTALHPSRLPRGPPALSQV